MSFRDFVIISLWQRVATFIWTNLNPHHPRMFCAKFCLNWPSGSGEEYENVKSLRQQRWWTMEKFWSEKLTWAFSSGELKIQSIFPIQRDSVFKVISYQWLNLNIHAYWCLQTLIWKTCIYIFYLTKLIILAGINFCHNKKYKYYLYWDFNIRIFCLQFVSTCLH